MWGLRETQRCSGRPPSGWYQAFETRGCRLPASQRGEGRCSRGLMFIHAALNSPFQYIFINRSNYLLKSRFAGENRVPGKEEQPTWAWALEARGSPGLGQSSLRFCPVAQFPSGPEVRRWLRSGIGAIS